MRRALVLMLATACNPSEECFPISRSVVTHLPSAIASGTELLGVAWRESIARNPPIGHAVLVDAAGTPSAEIQVSPDVRGIAGRRSVLWERRGEPSCARGGGPLDVTLHRPDGGTFVHVADAAVFSTATTFDGTHYQLFWIAADGHVRHRSLDEDGTLGAVQDLATAPVNTCIVAASDGAGQTMLRVATQVYEVGANTVRTVLELPDVGDLYYFAGKFHGRVVNELYSFTSTSSTHRPVPDFLFDAETFLPGTRSLFVVSNGGAVEVDADLVMLGRPKSAIVTGRFDGDFMRIELVLANAQVPGRLDLERQDGWTTTLATNSEVILEEDCAP